MYVKLFSSIYQGTLRGRPHCLLVFTNLLAHADSHGIVDMHPNAIADEVGLDVSEVRKTLLILEEPDSESRSPEAEGRRIVRLDEHRAWGWQIVNYVKYRSIKNEDDRREQNRAAQERWRNKNKQQSADVSRVSPDKPMQKQKQKQIQETSTASPGGFAEFWSAYPKKVGKPAAIRAFRSAKINGHMPQVLADIQTKAGTEAWTKAGGQFVPNPATYLNQRRWEDEKPHSPDIFAGAI